MSVRVRFAPSPTGFLHVGGARSALYNWLFARAAGGTFVLRSDDTDAARSTDEFRADIVASLEWLGLDWDEGIGVGGPHGSYRQSERLQRYQAVARELVASGKAYYSFETQDQLDGFRERARREGRPPAYDGSLRIDHDAAAAKVEAGEPAPIRFSVPRPGTTTFDDMIRGSVSFDHTQVDDFVLLRSDGTPTYHLASTVDDVDYAITHVVRGEDILPSTPKHILLTCAMGAEPPHYAHLSLLLGPDGSKLSKRHGHTAVRSYRDAGYLPEAVRNYLAILGWAAGDDEEIVPIDEMVHRFELTSVSKNPAVFDVVKLDWMNGAYIRALSAAEFAARARPWVERAIGRDLTAEEAEAFIGIAPLVQERAKTLAEASAQVGFLFGDIEWDEPSWEKVMTKQGAAEALQHGREALAGLGAGSWTPEAIEAACRSVVDSTGLKAGEVFQPLRVAVTGSSVSPPLFESMEALGFERTIDRIEAAVAALQA